MKVVLLYLLILMIRTIISSFSTSLKKFEYQLELKKSMYTMCSMP